MSENTTNGAIHVPSDAETFELKNGQSFTLNILEFVYEINDIWKAMKEAGKDHRDYCLAVRDRVAELNPGVLLSLGEADWIIDEVGTLHAKKKQKQAENTKNTLNLAASMATPLSS